MTRSSFAYRDERGLRASIGRRAPAATDDVARSDRPEVRNPVLGLAEYQVLLALPREQRMAFAILHRGIARTSLANAHKCRAQNKGPMAVYWREAAATHRHIANALRRGLA